MVFACKTFGCRNLGLANSTGYHYPDYRLGYPALCCEACGSYPPLFNDAEFGFWLSAYLTAYAHEVPFQGKHAGENRKMVCSLAHSRREKQTIPALTASQRFTKWLEKRPEFTQSALFSAGRVTQILASLAQKYNAALTAAAPDD